MPKGNCAVLNCSNSTYKLKKWKQEICYEHNEFGNSCKPEDCNHFIPPFKLYCFPSTLRNAELRNKRIRALKRQNKVKTEWKPSGSSSNWFALSILWAVLMKQILLQIYILNMKSKKEKQERL